MRPWVLGAAITMSTGCTNLFGNDGGQSGEEDARCDAVRTEALAEDGVSELGFGKSQIASLVDAVHTGTLAWDGGGSTALTIEVSELGAARFEDREYVDDGSGMEPAIEIGCADVVVLPAHVAFSTEDGAFAEAWDLDIEAIAADDAGFLVTLDLEALSGSFVFPGAEDYDDVAAFVDARFDASGAHGTLDGQGTTVEGEGPDGMVSATGIALGTW